MGEENINSKATLSPKICRELEKNPGCPFVKQITVNSNDIHWMKIFLKKKTVLDLLAYVGIPLSIIVTILTIVGGI